MAWLGRAIWICTQWSHGWQWQVHRWWTEYKLINDFFGILSVFPYKFCIAHLVSNQIDFVLNALVFSNIQWPCSRDLSRVTQSGQTHFLIYRNLRAPTPNFQLPTFIKLPLTLSMPIISHLDLSIVLLAYFCRLIVVVALHRTFDPCFDSTRPYLNRCHPNAAKSHRIEIWIHLLDIQLNYILPETLRKRVEEFQCLTTSKTAKTYLSNRLPRVQKWGWKKQRKEAFAKALMTDSCYNPQVLISLIMTISGSLREPK